MPTLTYSRACPWTDLQVTETRTVGWRVVFLRHQRPR